MGKRRKRVTKARTTRATRKAGSKTVGRQPSLSPDWGPSWLTALETLGAVSSACRATKVGVSTVYERRGRDEPFAKAWDRILAERHRFDEERFADLRRRAELTFISQAVDGIPRPKVSGGKVVRFRGKALIEREFPAHLQRLVAAHFLGWKDASRIEHTGADGGAIEIIDVRARLGDMLERVREAKLEDLARAAAKDVNGNGHTASTTEPAP